MRFLTGLIATTFTLLLPAFGVLGQDQTSVVRMAKLMIDPAQLEAYKTALKEEIETSIKVESGVTMLYAVAEKSDPSHITIFETYSNQQAYLSHLETPHFKKYKSVTKDMVKSLELIEVNPIVLGKKEKEK